ncbi:hypothetical protein JCM33374_g2655 [Metschnikowia sp. JCM 33374]|nr:hypothetical protein JCM33374_g2655 [Metschnikowia sp. JCM 33374]
MSKLLEKSGPKVSISSILNESKISSPPAHPLPSAIQPHLNHTSPPLAQAYEASRAHPAYMHSYGMAHNQYYHGHPQQHYSPYGDPRHVYAVPYPGVQMVPAGASMHPGHMSAVPINTMPYMPPHSVPPTVDGRPSLAQEHRPYSHPMGMPQHAPSPVPGQKSRRFRRRYYQIHRKYNCTYPGCTKSYGSLNHLNTHIVTKKHGMRKSKADFKHTENEQMGHAGHVAKDALHGRDVEAPHPNYSHAPFHMGYPVSVSPVHAASVSPERTPQMMPNHGVVVGSTPQAWASTWQVQGQVPGQGPAPQQALLPGPPHAHANGGVNGHVSGHAKDNVSDNVNGHTDGQVNGSASGEQNTQVNVQAQRQALPSMSSHGSSGQRLPSIPSIVGGCL